MKDTSDQTVAIVGSRTYKNEEELFRLMDGIYLDTLFTKIVSGGAAGADSLGAKYARIRGFTKLIIRPDWKTYGRSAGFMRNQLIVDACDFVVAFWDGKSKGTLDTLKKAEKIGKRTIIFVEGNLLDA